MWLHLLSLISTALKKAHMYTYVYIHWDVNVRKGLLQTVHTHMKARCWCSSSKTSSRIKNAAGYPKFVSFPACFPRCGSSAQALCGAPPPSRPFGCSLPLSLRSVESSIFVFGSFSQETLNQLNEQTWACKMSQPGRSHILVPPLCVVSCWTLSLQRLGSCLLPSVGWQEGSCLNRGAHVRMWGACAQPGCRQAGAHRDS